MSLYRRPAAAHPIVLAKRRRGKRRRDRAGQSKAELNQAGADFPEDNAALDQTVCGGRRRHL